MTLIVSIGIVAEIVILYFMVNIPRVSPLP